MKFDMSRPIFLFWAYTALFFASAAVGVWAAPDRLVAGRHFILMVGGVTLIWFMLIGHARWPTHIWGLAGAFIALLGAIVAVRFFIDLAGPGWAAVSAAMPLPPLHKNLTGGAQVIALPLGWLAMSWSRQLTRPWLSWGIGFLVILSFLGLLLSRSAGAWLGAAGGFSTGGYVWWRLGRPRSEKGRLSLIDAAVGGGVLVLGGWSWLLLALPWLAAFVEPLLAGVGRDLNRLILWRDSLNLLHDYFWTGSGLGATSMVYSSYVYMLHVPFIPHAHNLLMQIGIEQGIVGLLAFVGLCGAALWGVLSAAPRSQAQRAVAAAGTAALVGLLAHGSVEAGLYAHDMGFVLFIPLAFLVPLARPAARPAPIRRYMVGATLPLLLAFLPLGGPAGRAQLLANRGAVHQTRAELGLFVWPAIPLQDDLRRPGGAELGPARQLYQRALARDPDNRTALRRLGQIALSVGEYEQAERLLERAMAAEPSPTRPVQQMLGELAALKGDAAAAASFWHQIDLNNGQLDLRTWWYEHRGSAERAAAFAHARTVYEER